MFDGYHLLLKQHAAKAILSRTVDIPKPELGIEFAKITNPIIPPVELKPQMPVRVKVNRIKTLDDVLYAGKGKIVDKNEFPVTGWMGDNLAGV